MKSGRAPKELRALTLVELLVVLAVIVLFVLLVPGDPSARAKAKAMQAACQSNLKQIGIALRTWEGDHGDKYPMSVPKDKGGSLEYGAGREMFRHFQVMSNELNNPKIVLCPSDDRWFAPAVMLPNGITTNDFSNLSNSNISYFVELDADETRPAMILSGDRNLLTNGVKVVPGLVVIRTNDSVGWSAKMHNLTGNFGLADGSVQKGSSWTFQTFLSRTGTNVNRLAVP